MNVRSNIHWVWIGVVLGGLVACDRGSRPTARGIAVKVAPVAHTTAQAGTRYSAEIAPVSHVEVAWKVGGYVESLRQVRGVDGVLRPIQEGDVVEAGTPLATLRQVEYQQKIAEARAAVAEASAVYRQARLDHGRDARLARSGSLPGATSDTSRSQRDSAGAALAGARVRLAQARTVLTDTTLIAPMTGVVTRRAIEVGSLATPGSIAFSIADTSSVKAVFGVPDLVLPQVAVGATLRVASEALPDVTLEGTVSRLAPSADAKSRVFEVDVTIPNPGDRLKVGMVVALSIRDAPPSREMMVVPLTAIVRAPEEGEFAVFVVKRTGAVERAYTRVVALGEYLGTSVPVLDGLVGDEKIVVQGAGLLSHGERVEVIP